VNHSQIVSFLWGVADLLRDTFKRSKYQDVILPLTVLRRLDCVLAPTRDQVRKRQAELKGRGLEDLDAALRKSSGFAFYNTSRYDFDTLLADAPHLAANLRNYIAGFSANMREVLEKFDFDNTISKLDESGLLFQVLERFRNVDLHPEKIDNPAMGTIFEELIRRFNEEPDPELRDTESVPLPDGDDPVDADGVPASVRAFFEREVRPHVPDAWIETARRDSRDGLVGLVGYEINFNRYFYRYTPPRPLEEIEADIRAIEGDIVRMLSEVTGTQPIG
jgi:hypothetical protein